MSWTATSLRTGDVLAFGSGAAGLFVSVWDAHQGGLYRAEAEGQSWRRCGRGLPAAGHVTALADEGDVLWAGLMGHGVYRSADAGRTWKPAGDGLPAPCTVLALAVHDGRLFAGTEANGLYRRAADGRWEAASAGLPLDGRPLRVHALSVAAGDVIASHDFGMHRSADGAAWEVAGFGLPPGALLTTLAAADGTLYAYGPEHLYRSADGGRNWTALSQAFPGGGFIRSLAVLGGVLYVGMQGAAESGVYASADGGRTWTGLNEGLPRPAWSILLYPDGDHLVAGVGSRGIWRRPLPVAPAVAPGAEARFQLEAGDPNPFATTTEITYVLEREGHVELKVTDLLGREVAVLVDGVRSVGRHQAVFDGRDLPGGMYRCQMRVGVFSQTRPVLLLK